MWELDSKGSWAPKNWCVLNCGVEEDSLSVPWTARRSNQSILKEIIPEYSLEGLMLKMKLQYIDHCEELTHLKRSWCWERLTAGGEGDDRGWDGWMASPTQWTWVWASSGSWWWTGRPGMLQSMGSQRVGHDWATELNWWWLLKDRLGEFQGEMEIFLILIMVLITWTNTHVKIHGTLHQRKNSFYDDFKNKL